MKLHCAYSLLFFSLLSMPVVAQAEVDEIVINEVLASNDASFSPAGESTSPDVVELLNLSSDPVDLSGYFFSDNLANPLRWPFPAGTTIPANGFLVVICDGSGGARPDFRLSAGGEDLILSDPSGVEIANVSFPRQRTDVSYARFSDGSYGFFPEVTIGSANAEASALTSLVGRPSVNQESGFYETPFEVVLEPDELGDVIHFTTDGSAPDAGSPVYSGAITVSETMVLRAIALREGEASESAMRSFLFEDIPELPVVILTSDQETIAPVDTTSAFFTPYTRYMIDGRVRFDFLEDDGRLEISQYAEFETSGRTSETRPPLNGKIFARARLGPRFLNHQFFPEKEERRFERVLLRNTSQDFSEARMRDGLHSYMLGQDNIVEFEEEGFRPVVVYLNGRFLGHMNIREDDDAEFARQYFSDAEILQRSRGLRFDHFFLGVDHRAANALDELNSLITLDTQLVDSLLRASGRGAEGNTWFEFADRPGFRNYLLHDYDSSLGERATFTRVTGPFNDISIIGSPRAMPGDALWNEIVQGNAAFFNLFAYPERWLEKIDRIEAAMSPVMPATINYYNSDLASSGFTVDDLIARRGGSRVAAERSDLIALDMPQWLGYVDEIRTFVNTQYSGVLEAMETRFAFLDIIELNISSSDTSQGDVRVHQFRVTPGREVGSYFQGIPLRLKAEPKPGFEFVRWEGLAAGETTEEINMAFNSAGNITAVFKPSAIIAARAGNLVVSEIHYNPLGTEESGEFLELTNISSSALNLEGLRFIDGIDYVFPAGSTLAADASLIVTPVDYMGNLSNDGEQIVLVAADGSVIEDFTYNDSRLWPAAADGLGHSLTRIRPDLLLDPNLPSSWRASRSEGGSPADSDVAVLAGNSDEELRAYFFGDSNIEDALRVNRRDDGTFDLRFQRVSGADDVAARIETSQDLSTWFPLLDQTLLSPEVPEGGFEQLQTEVILLEDEQRYYRLSLSPR